MTSEKRKLVYRSIKILLETPQNIILILLIRHTYSTAAKHSWQIRSTCAINTRDTPHVRRWYAVDYEKRVEDTSHIRSRYERYALYTSRLRRMLTATYVWRIRSMSYVSTAYLPRCFRMYHVCVTYVRRIGPATYVLRICKCTHKK